MRFSGVRQVTSPVEEVWAALHDPGVLRAAIPGCERLDQVAPGRYGATLAARVGRLADTYRGTFDITDLDPGSRLRVSVASRGRCGTLGLELDVELGAGSHGRTALAYEAHACVGGLVSRLGRATLTVTGGHLTGCFFRDLEKALPSHPVAFLR
jgi:carbon monoxide dehydrogenase subunit G